MNPTTPAPKRPYEPEYVRERLSTYVKEVKFEPVVKGIQGAILGCMNMILKSDGDIKKAEDRRRLVLGYLFGPTDQLLKPKSSHELTPEQWFALSKWCNLMRTAEGKWYPVQEFYTELLHVENAALRQYLREQTQMEALAGIEETDG